MKKIYLVIISLLLVLFGVGCNAEKTYKDGDQIIIDGLIYEYNTPKLNEETNLLDAPYFNYETATITDPERPIYHSAYPIDMLHPEDFPITKSDLYEDNWSSLSYQSLSYTTNRGVLLDDTYSTQPKIFNPVTCGENDVMFALNNVDRNYVWENSCFWVVGSTDDLKSTKEDEYVMTSIKIPSMINGIVVAGIGYGALNDVVIMDLSIEGLSSMDSVMYQ